MVRRRHRLGGDILLAQSAGAGGVVMAVSAQALAPPLCVDLDGALIRSDVLLESLLVLLKRNPLYLFLAVGWLLRGGKDRLQAELATRVELNAAALPYDKDLLAWLQNERNAGRELWLCSTANMGIAAKVAQHLGLFDHVVQRNGIEISALPVFVTGVSRYRAILRALRPHQWAKNVLVLVPLLTAHRLGDWHALVAGLAAVVAFCLCASSVYLLNDMLDLEADRGHPRKSKRPFASGDLSLATGLVLAPALLAVAALIAAFLPGKFQLFLAAYYVLTFGYSVKLKRMLLVDAVALAGLYTLRIMAGAGAVMVPLSFWLLLFSVFLFLSLAFVKRYAELDALRRQQRLAALGRGYRVEDLAVLQSFGTAAGYLSVLVLALYINSPEIAPLYHRPKAIWMLCVLMLYWISRVWMTAHRGGMHDDPVVYALRDRVSLGIGLLAAITVAVAI
jgi:4-hydroxybenzoate polyprenyltransferase